MQSLPYAGLSGHRGDEWLEWQPGGQKIIGQSQGHLPAQAGNSVRI